MTLHILKWIGGKKIASASPRLKNQMHYTNLRVETKKITSKLTAGLKTAITEKPNKLPLMNKTLYKTSPTSLPLLTSKSTQKTKKTKRH